MQIVVRQISGLGNQLFQYAAGRYYSKRYGAQFRIAVDPARKAVSHGYARPFLLSHFSITTPAKELSQAERFILSEKPWLKPAIALVTRPLGIQVFREKRSQFYTFLQDLPLENNIRTLYIAGYWQTHRMVDDIGEELRVDLRFKEAAKGENLEVLDQIRQSKNSVSLHIRRGDYTLAAEGKIALPIEYYYRAIDALRIRLAEPVFFVFSDDIAFAKENLPRDIRTVFVEHNDAFSSHEDLRLMSSCQHHIIANSSFSWWGAWLNPRSDKIVFAPRYWHLRADSYYPGLFPPDWILGEF
jgi:hypothetical protein